MNFFGQLMGYVRLYAMAYCRCALLALVLSLGSQAANAQTQKSKQQATIDQSQAIQSARQRVDGRVLRVERTDRNFRIKMLAKSGRVVSVDVDRFTGRVTRQSTVQKSQKEN